MSALFESRKQKLSVIDTNRHVRAFTCDLLAKLAEPTRPTYAGSTAYSMSRLFVGGGVAYLRREGGLSEFSKVRTLRYKIVNIV